MGSRSLLTWGEINARGGTGGEKGGSISEEDKGDTEWGRGGEAKRNEENCQYSHTEFRGRGHFR